LRIVDDFEPALVRTSYGHNWFNTRAPGSLRSWNHNINGHNHTGNNSTNVRGDNHNNSNDPSHSSIRSDNSSYNSIHSDEQSYCARHRSHNGNRRDNKYDRV
jgi:hypothetical protein